MITCSFRNDYSEGCHPAILELMAQSNFVQEDGYGNDAFSIKAKEQIRRVLHNFEAAIHFVTGGTQANLIVLSSLLKPYESIIAPESAHINTHETGAVEGTGHKINPVESICGKITPDRIQEVVDAHSDEHMVKPGVVFISNATELGTVYRKNELVEISRVCKKNRLYLYMDGARIGSALSSKASDLTFSDLSELIDVYTIGGTKNGALAGEAVVINRPGLLDDFRYHMKLRGGLQAKGRLLGIQFLGLFQNGLYFTLAGHANAMAEKMAQQISAMGFSFLVPPETNQIFPILPDTLISGLEKHYGFYIWKKIDPDHSAVRLVTSWATTEKQVEGFLTDFKSMVRS